MPPSEINQTPYGRTICNSKPRTPKFHPYYHLYGRVTRQQRLMQLRNGGIRRFTNGRKVQRARLVR